MIDGPAIMEEIHRGIMRYQTDILAILDERADFDMPQATQTLQFAVMRIIQDVREGKYGDPIAEPRDKS